MVLPAAFNGHRRVPPPTNDPIRSYEPGSAERASIKARLAALASDNVDIPIIIGGKEIRTGDTAPVVMPHDHHHVLGYVPQGNSRTRAAGDRDGRGGAGRVVPMAV